ncbi:MAG: hypothetical protein R3B90_09040 [Planctomycetaceae bacterium]
MLSPYESGEAATVANLDGLDELQSESSAESTIAYGMTPLSSILPYHDYSPTGAEVCGVVGQANKCPNVRSLPVSAASHDRCFPHLEYYWQPSNVFSQPLYFEDPGLERSGHTYGPILQPLASSARFGVQLIGLPYQMALDPPCRKVYPLGYHRPGECAPKLSTPVPLNAKAAVVSGAAYTGLIFAFP